MIRIEQDGLSYFQFENLAGFANLDHGFFARGGGVSAAPFRSLNVGLGVGDPPENVGKNRHLISRCLGWENLIFVRQVHGDHVLVCGSKGRPYPPPQSGSADTGDAMIGDTPGFGLVIQVADCQAVFMYDPLRRVVANIHSGWRGSIGNIIGKTVSAMVDRFGCRPADIVAGVGPSLGPCCAEFVNYKVEIPEKLWQYKDGRHHIDFWALSRDQLCHAGVRADRIELSGLCTRCRTDLFFSYRGEKTTGRCAAVIGMKSNQTFEPRTQNRST